jgi:hypothetical protein
MVDTRPSEVKTWTSRAKVERSGPFRSSLSIIQLIKRRIPDLLGMSLKPIFGGVNPGFGASL